MPASLLSLEQKGHAALDARLLEHLGGPVQDILGVLII